MTTQNPPTILVVGTGSRGGIGRFERLLMAALRESSQQGAFTVESIWRRRHPAYLQESPEHTQTQQDSDLLETSMPIFLAQIARAIARTRPDLVLFLHINLARAAPLARMLGNRRYAIATYGVEVWSPLDWVRRRALLGASEVLSISDYTADQLERHQRLPQGRARVIPLALEPQWVQTADRAALSVESARQSHGATTLLSVSRLDTAARDKGIDRVIKALPEVRAAIPEVRYHVVGDGNDRAYLESVAADSGVADVVRFTGLLSHEELIEEYRTADAFILPSEREGFGLVFLEAMVFGKPVIARRAAAAIEVIVDNQTGILVEDEHGLATAMIKMLSDNELAQQMGQAGRQRAQEVYSFERFTARVEAALLSTTD